MKKYCEKWDSYYESETGKWLESKCEDKNCEWYNRPDIHIGHEECGLWE